MAIGILGVPAGSTLSQEIAKAQTIATGKTVTYAEIQAKVDKAVKAGEKTLSAVNILGVPTGSTLSQEIAKAETIATGKAVTYADIQAKVDKTKADAKNKGYIGFGIIVAIALLVISFLD